MKIILSRKGFDSGAGGYPSPFFVKERRLLSLPIPEENKIYTADTGRLYSDLLFDDTQSKEQKRMETSEFFSPHKRNKDDLS